MKMYILCIGSKIVLTIRQKEGLTCYQFHRNLEKTILKIAATDCRKTRSQSNYLTVLSWPESDKRQIYSCKLTPE